MSEFVVTGRGSLPPAPSNLLNSDAVWIDLDSTGGLTQNTPSSSQATYRMTNYIAQPLVEATGWELDDKGEVVLIAATPDSLRLKGRCYVR